MAKKQSKWFQADKVWGVTRISLGFVFLWAFLDKTFGLGYATCNNEGVIERMCERAWVNGGSPTTGFLKFGTSGPFSDFFNGLAGNSFVDWLFMLGLLGIGIGLILGIAMKVAVISGMAMMTLMYLATIQPENNPLIDDHVIYALVLAGLYAVNDKQKYGFKKAWAKQPIVKKYPWLA